MRKQYHFRKRGEDTLIWDVHRLIRLSQDFEINDIPLSDIKELDEVFWFQHPPEKPTCRAVAHHAKLIQQTNLEHPIIMCPESRILDGMHRVCKALVLGEETIKSRKFNTMPKPDFVNISAEDLPYQEEDI